MKGHVGLEWWENFMIFHFSPWVSKIGILMGFGVLHRNATEGKSSRN